VGGKSRGEQPVANNVNITISERHGRKCAGSGSPWESTGTVGLNSDGTYPDTLEGQTRRSLEIIRAAIEALGGKIEHVIRTRIYVIDATQWEQVAKVHGQLFGETRPATALVEVAKLIDDEALIEIEADAVIPQDQKPSA
jgi:enamine deaminase RidA (YjgF/YER057c/UK114 family)